MDNSHRKSLHREGSSNSDFPELVIRTRKHQETNSNIHQQHSSGRSAPPNRPSHTSGMACGEVFSGLMMWTTGHQQKPNDISRDPPSSKAGDKAENTKPQQPGNEADEWVDCDKISQCGSENGDDWVVEGAIKGAVEDGDVEAEQPVEEGAKETVEEPKVPSTAVGHFHHRRSDHKDDPATARRRLAELEAQIAKLEHEARKPRGPSPTVLPGNIYGDIIVRGSGTKVFRGNITTGGQIPKYVRVNQYGRTYADGGAQIFDGNYDFHTAWNS